MIVEMSVRRVASKGSTLLFKSNKKALIVKAFYFVDLTSKKSNQIWSLLERIFKTKSVFEEFCKNLRQG
jgi:hypothetical protein